MAKNTKTSNEPARFQYTINRSYILRGGNSALLFLAVVSGTLGIFVQVNKDKIGSSLLPVLILTDIVMITVGVLMIRYMLQVRRTPREIKIRNHNLTIDNETFLRNTITSMKMTRSDKALRLLEMRRLEFVSNGKKRRFYLGTGDGIPASEYRRLYEEVTSGYESVLKE